jgi:hypothetical protein
VHRNLAEWVPCLGVLHVVCASEAILVSLLLAFACCANVPIFDVKAAFDRVHFAWGALSLLCTSLNIWYHLCSSDKWYGHLWTASTAQLPAPAATASTSILLCVHALQFAGAYCSTLVDSGVMLGVGRSVVGCV